MNPSRTTVSLQAYGMARMVLGVAQIVGLCLGYFFLEWIIRYPSNSILYVIDSEVLALTYLAILLRALFHILAGIGIARLAGWVRAWIAWGWPIVALITLGLYYSIASGLLLEGFIDRMAFSLSWPKLFLYIAWACADIFYINRLLSAINEKTVNRGEEAEALPLHTISVIFFVSIAIFVVLIFLGTPIKQGFHKGFYRASGQRTDVKKEIKTTRSVQQKKRTA